MKAKYTIVLAEEATQIYRDTRYGDLISFEEDIARISAVVLVIAESAGSLAELGAFSSNDTIRSRLRVIIPTHHEVEESFVRYGPVERIKRIDRSHLGVYPWKTHKKGGLNVSSAKPHYKEIVKFISDHIKSVSDTTLYSRLDDDRLFFIIYWIIHISLAISPKLLYGCVKSIEPSALDHEIRNKIYCMQLAQWVGMEAYSGKDYFYAMHDEEPFSYKYKDGTSDTSYDRRKLAVQEGLRKAENLPLHIRKVAAAARVASL